MPLTLTRHDPDATERALAEYVAAIMPFPVGSNPGYFAKVHHRAVLIDRLPWIIGKQTPWPPDRT